MLWRTTPEKLFHQITKIFKALESRESTWEGHDTSGCYLQKCLNTNFQGTYSKLFQSRYACVSQTSVQRRQEYLQFLELLLSLADTPCFKDKIIIQHETWRIAKCAIPQASGCNLWEKFSQLLLRKMLVWWLQGRLQEIFNDCFVWLGFPA